MDMCTCIEWWNYSAIKGERKVEKFQNEKLDFRGVNFRLHLPYYEILSNLDFAEVVVTRRETDQEREIGADLRGKEE